MEEPIAAWEDEGGAAARTPESPMTGTVNQIAWAEQIKTKVEAEFDRVRAALEAAATRQSGQRRTDTQAMITILEEKRAEVMANRQAGYFIHLWQEVRGQVRELILGDSRYKAIKFRPESQD
jgi:hypothetical protein